MTGRSLVLVTSLGCPLKPLVLVVRKGFIVDGNSARRDLAAVIPYYVFVVRASRIIHNPIFSLKRITSEVSGLLAWKFLTARFL
jgi:hypothetical protein